MKNLNIDIEKIIDNVLIKSEYKIKGIINVMIRMLK